MSRKLCYALFSALDMNDHEVYKVVHFIRGGHIDKDREAELLKDMLEEAFSLENMPDEPTCCSTPRETYVEYLSYKQVVQVGEVPLGVKDGYDYDYNISTYNQYSDNDD